MGACLDTEVIRVLGTMRGDGVWWGGVKDMQVHTGDEKTTKRWEADDRARDRLKKDGQGKTTKKGTVVVVSLIDT